MKNLLKAIFRKLGIEITRYNSNPKHPVIVSLKPDNNLKGNMLLSYVIEPFLLKENEKISNAHTHDWESMQIATTFLKLGYAVDVIDYRDSTFIPQKHYSFFIGARTDFERITQFLNVDCVKIVHLDTSHWIFNNFATYKRTLELKQRKGISIKKSQRIVEHNLAIEYADFATILGNQFTINTYSYARKPLYRVPVSTCALYEWPEAKNFEASRKNYLWFGPHGFVHKGLDLVLDAFAEMPDYHLYVGGPIEREKDFESIYYKELYQTPNIHTIGWLDVNGHRYLNIANKCIALIYPSCAEGQSGAVINCLHAGLIPIISYESGIDVGDFGIILHDCGVQTIKDSVQMISGLSANELQSMSRKTWEYARMNHTREKFTEEYRKVIEKIMNLERKIKV